MNPFVQTGLGKPQSFPTQSATIPTSASNSPSQTPASSKWAAKRHPKNGGVLVDDRFRVKIISEDTPSHSHAEATMQDVFALGDVAVLETGRLPATAQVANQEAKWLGKRLNNGDLDENKFEFRNLGVMTYLGNMKAIMQTEGNKEIKG